MLITGAYGTGKTSVTAEIADLLEDRGLTYAAIDLDWLAWADTGSKDESAEHRMMLTNLASVVANYLEAGIWRFILAGAFREGSELKGLIAALPMRVRLVRLSVPNDVIEERLDSEVMSGRHDDLRAATDRVARSDVEGVEDRTVPNDRPIRETAVEILDWLGWADGGRSSR